MRKEILFFWFLMGFCFLYQTAYGQITGVKYQLAHDFENNAVDIYIIISEGNSTENIHRVQFNSQISLAVPTEMEPLKINNYMPLNDHLEYQGETPTRWILNSIVVNAQDDGIDYYSISPNLHPTGFYDDLKEGDTIKIFSLTFENPGACIGNIRLYDNENDPTSQMDGMFGSDFSNSFTIGDIESVYQGNAPIIKSEALIIEGNHIVSLIKSSSYEWYDCSTDTKLSTEQVGRFIPPAEGQYYAIIKDSKCQYKTECINFKYSLRP